MEEITISRKELKSAVKEAMFEVITGDDFEDRECALFVGLSGNVVCRKVEEKLFGKEPDDDKADSEKEDK